MNPLACPAGEQTAPVLLSIESLEAWYGEVQALHGLSMHLRQGSVLAVLGPNGAGKTTLLRALCGQVRRRGRIRFANQSIDTLHTEQIARLGIAQVQEGRGTFAELSVAENLRLGGILRKDRSQRDRELEQWFHYFPRLHERRDQQAGTLSGGEQQMLALARVLLSRPRLLLLDEPSFGLAPRGIEEMFAILHRLRREQQLSMLIVEQQARRALELADTACLIENGRVRLSEQAASMVARAEIRAGYLGLDTQP